MAQYLKIREDGVWLDDEKLDHVERVVVYAEAGEPFKVTLDVVVFTEVTIEGDLEMTFNKNKANE